jgi:hypothetical protein
VEGDDGMAFLEEQLKNGQKWKSKQELLTLVETLYMEKVKRLNYTIEAILEKELAQFLLLTWWGHSFSDGVASATLNKSVTISEFD